MLKRSADPEPTHFNLSYSNKRAGVPHKETTRDPHGNQTLRKMGLLYVCSELAGRPAGGLAGRLAGRPAGRPGGGPAANGPATGQLVGQGGGQISCVLLHLFEYLF